MILLNLIRCEAHHDCIKKIIEEPSRAAIVEKFKSLGFKFITVDMQGFRSGALNEVLTEAQRQKK